MNYSGVALLMMLLAGCGSTNVRNAEGIPPQDLNPGQRGPVSGVGIEGADIVAMTDQMMRDLLAVPRLAGTTRPPRVIIDGEFFANEGTQPLNKSLITDRLRVNLNRVAAGRMVFVGRQYAGMVGQERELKRQGLTDVGTIGTTKAQLGADYRLGGRIATLDARNKSSGVVQRYSQVTFEMIDLETGEIVWSGMYELQRAAADAVIYR